VDLANEQRPDLAANTGDFVTRSPSYPPAHFASPYASRHALPRDEPSLGDRS
jgi:hypothetical protein